MTALTQSAVSDTVRAADAAAATLRERIVGLEAPGTRLGSVADLSAELGISVPTLRQALRLLENEGLVVARRGRNGGIYAGPPNIGAISGVAETYLRMAHVPLIDLLKTTGMLSREALKLAVKDAGDDERQALVQLYSRPLVGMDPEEILDLEWSINEHLGQATRSPSMALLLIVILDITDHALRRGFYACPTLVEVQQQANRALARAMQDRDPDAIDGILDTFNERAFDAFVGYASVPTSEARARA